MAAGRRGGVDGGWGWVVVGSCFMVMVCTRAVTRCVSIFFVEFQDHFGADYSATSWIHSLLDSTTMLCAPVGSLLGARWSCRAAVMLGGLLSSCGLLLSSFSSSLEQLYLNMGVLTGVGFSLCYTPAVSMVGRYFRGGGALAFGVALSGGGVGTVVLAPAVQRLIEFFSWRGALLLLSGFTANLCVCGALLRPITARDGEEGAGPGDLSVKLSGEDELSPSPQQRRLTSCFLSSRDFHFLLLPDFLFLALSFLFLAAGCSLPFVFLVPYALSVGVISQHAALLMAILGAIGIVGNITFGWITDRRCLRRHRLACYVVAVAMEGACCLLAPLLRSFPLLVPFAVVYGYFDGAYVALIPVVTADTVGPAHLTLALGVVYFLHAVPYLISPPIGGWLVDVTGSYTATFLLSGAALLCSSVILFTAAAHRRYRGNQRPTRPRQPTDPATCTHIAPIYNENQDSL